MKYKWPQLSVLRNQPMKENFYFVIGENYILSLFWAV